MIDNKSPPNEEALHFESVEELRGWYIVKYDPPIPDYRFATLTISLLERRAKSEVAAEMESELKRWSERYPVPLMVSAFGVDLDPVDLSDEHESSHLIGISNLQDGLIKAEWRLLANDEISSRPLTNEELRAVYAGIPYKTSLELRERAVENAKRLRRGKWIIAFWVCIGPALVAAVEFLSPQWVAVFLLLITWYKALQEYRKMTGKAEQSERKKRKLDDQALMRHHHYHCLRNPEGFSRLKLENFDRWEREQEEARVSRLKGK